MKGRHIVSDRYSTKCKHGVDFAEYTHCAECSDEEVQKLEKENEILIEFTEWCINNWQCDGWSEGNTSKEFCKSPQCRRCSAKRIIDRLTE